MSIAPTPSRIHLPKLPQPPATILTYLCRHFPRVPAEIWCARIAQGHVWIGENTPITETTPYAHGLTVSYYRQVETEIEVPFQEKILFQNDHILVADKPHFLPVTPAGPSVNECLLYRLQRHTGIATLTPLHRLDRDTAGLVLFSKVKAERAAYTKLFTDQSVVRKYSALASITGQIALRAGQEWLVENRIVEGTPWFRMQIADRSLVDTTSSTPPKATAPNARTKIILKEMRSNLGLFELLPQTGKKHQLRLHMMSIGFPILNDPFYPELDPRDPQDYSQPMQLLARHLLFQDPITGSEISFESEQKLMACNFPA